MKRKLTFLLLSCFFAFFGYTQNIEDLKGMKAEKEAQAASIAAEIADLSAQIDKLDTGWKYGSFGTIGFNLSSFNNWVTQSNPNSLASTIVASFNGFANQKEDHFFWRNAANIALGWQKLVKDKDLEPDAEFEQVADVINLTSLFGRNLTSTLAASALGEFRSTLLNNFLDPGYLDLGVGATWNPVPELVVVTHPLNYNIVMAKSGSDYQSSMGAKIVADYVKNFKSGFNLRSNFSSFWSYKDSDLSNFTWTTGVGFKALKNIGVGIEYALRMNKQETQAAEVEDDNQNYWILGLTYNF